MFSLMAYWRGEVLRYWVLLGDLDQLMADIDNIDYSEFTRSYQAARAAAHRIKEDLKRNFGGHRRSINTEPDTRDLINGFVDAEDDISSLMQRRETVESCLHYRRDAEAEAEVYRRDLDWVDNKLREVAARRQGFIDSLKEQVRVERQGIIDSLEKESL